MFTRSNRRPTCLALIGGLTLAAGLTTGGVIWAMSDDEPDAGTQQTYPVRETDYVFGTNHLVEGTDTDEPAEPLEGTTWTIDDPTLRAAVVGELYGAQLIGKDSSSLRLTVEEDAEQLESLAIPEGVESLAGLEAAINLEELEIQPSKDLDLTPVGSLTNLTSLDLSYSEVQDIRALAGLKLETLSLSDTPMRDISALAGMPLTTLNLSNTAVSDLSPLSDMNSLELLYLDGSGVTDLGPLSKVPLRTLFADDLAVKDWTPVDHVETVLN